LSTQRTFFGTLYLKPSLNFLYNLLLQKQYFWNHLNTYMKKKVQTNKII
jgi:hypothetical protein